MTTIEAWKHSLAQQYGTSPYLIVPSNSFTAWGYGRTKTLRCTVRSPRGGRYTVFAPKDSVVPPTGETP
jgi:hypothetical protein